MACDKIITIGRQSGSGGRVIGRTLAEKLNIPFYDKELLKEAAKESGMCEEIFDSFDERPTNSFLYSLVMDPYSMGFGMTGDLPLNHKVFLAAFDTIKSLAEKDGSCIFVGRCADYALKDLPNVINVFVYAEMEDRIKRVMEEFDVSDSKAKDIIKKGDKSRASYYNYYTSKRWGEMKGYDICLNTSLYGVEKSADILYDIITKY